MADLTPFSDTLAITRASPLAGLQVRPRPGRTSYAFTGTAVLADVSGSMLYKAGDGRTRIDVLRGALADTHQVGMRLVAFSDEVTELASPARLPTPGGPTMLHLAIDHILRPPPAAVLVITDGRVDQPERALRSAEGLPAACTVSALYVGPDDDRLAIAFLGELCRPRGGRVEVRDLRKLLPDQSGQQAVATAIRGLLT